MKKILVTTAMLLPLFASAGDNGSYTQCRSASGKTILTMGSVGSSNNDATVELEIEKKSYGPATIDEGVSLTVEENGTLLKFTELDHFGEDWVTVKTGKVSSSGRSKAKILSGLNPRTGKPLTFQINLSCEIVYNPI